VGHAGRVDAAARFAEACKRADGYHELRSVFVRLGLFDRLSGVVDERLATDRLRIEGSFPIEDFNERFGRDLPTDDYNSIGGFVFGELGLTGEVRPVTHGEERLRELIKLGYTRVILPRDNLPRSPPPGCR